MWNKNPMICHSHQCHTQQSVINSLSKQKQITHPSPPALSPHVLFSVVSVSHSHQCFSPCSLFLYKSRWENTSLPPTGLNVVPVKSHSQHLLSIFFFFFIKWTGKGILHKISWWQSVSVKPISHFHVVKHTQSAMYIYTHMHTDSTHTHTCTNTDTLKSIT